MPSDIQKNNAVRFYRTTSDEYLEKRLSLFEDGVKQILNQDRITADDRRRMAEYEHHVDLLYHVILFREENPDSVDLTDPLS
jgi:hypothetical protein